MAAPAQAIRDAVVRLIDETPDKKEGRMYVALDQGSDFDMSSFRIDQLFEDDQECLIVHASCELAAYLVLADKIVEKTSTSTHPATYEDFFGETPEGSVEYLSIMWCTLHEIGRDDEVHWFPIVSGRSTKRARDLHTVTQ